MRSSKRNNKELRYKYLQYKKEREKNARDYIAAAETSEEKQYRNERYKAERLRKEYAKLRRLQAEHKREEKSRRRKQDIKEPTGDLSQVGSSQSETLQDFKPPVQAVLEHEIRGQGESCKGYQNDNQYNSHISSKTTLSLYSENVVIPADNFCQSKNQPASERKQNNMSRT